MCNFYYFCTPRDVSSVGSEHRLDRAGVIGSSPIHPTTSACPALSHLLFISKCCFATTVFNQEILYAITLTSTYLTLIISPGPSNENRLLNVFFVPSG